MKTIRIQMRALAVLGLALTGLTGCLDGNNLGLPGPSSTPAAGTGGVAGGLVTTLDTLSALSSNNLVGPSLSCSDGTKLLVALNADGTGKLGWTNASGMTCANGFTTTGSIAGGNAVAKLSSLSATGRYCEQYAGSHDIKILNSSGWKLVLGKSGDLPFVTCSAPAVSTGGTGDCGAANGTNVSAAPSAYLCSDGTKPTVNLVGNQYQWNCSTNQCYATRITGSCGTAVTSGQAYSAAPAAGELCASGTASAVSGGASDGKFSWTCGTASCQVNYAAAGACGTANGGKFTSAPSSNLCSSGTASAVTSATDKFNWTCGTQACSATKATLIYAKNTILGQAQILNYIPTGAYYQGAKCDIIWTDPANVASCYDTGSGHWALKCPANTDQGMFYQTVSGGVQKAVMLYCLYNQTPTATVYAPGSVIAQYKFFNIGNEPGYNCSQVSNATSSTICTKDAGGQWFGTCPSGSTKTEIGRGPLHDPSNGQAVYINSKPIEEILYNCVVQ